MARDPLASERQQLRSLLEQYHPESTTLPNLTNETSQNWLESFQQQVQEWLDAFWDWFREVSGPLPPIDMEADWTSWLPPVFWVSMAVVLGWLLYRLAQNVLGPNSGWRASELAASSVSVEAQLGDALATAVTDGRWALAARLRWRLFLSRMRFQAHVTPREYFGEPQHRDQWQQLEGTPIHEQYEVMFAATSASPQWFETYNRVLSQLENRESNHG